MDARTKRLIKRNQCSSTVEKRSRRKLNYTVSELATQEIVQPDALYSETPPIIEAKNEIIAHIVTEADEDDMKCILLRIPKSVSFLVLSYLSSKDFGFLEIAENETMELVREELENRVELIYSYHQLPIEYFATTGFWRYKWWCINIITNCPFHDLEGTLESARTIKSPTPSSPAHVPFSPSSSSSSSSSQATATKVLEMHRNESSYRLKGFSQYDGKSHVNLSENIRNCGRHFWNEKTKQGNYSKPFSPASACSSHSCAPVMQHSKLPLTPHSTPSVSSSSYGLSLPKFSSEHSIASSWLRELHSWDNAFYVPEQGSLGEACFSCPADGHIILAPGVHVLTDQLVINKNLQIIGSVNEKGIPNSVIRSSQGVFRVANGVHLGLYGVGVWCYSHEFMRRNAVAVDAKASFYATHSQIKCVSGRYCGGLLVQNSASVLLHECSVSACTGSGVILFGVGQFRNCEFFDNHFNGIEVQNCGEAYVSCCHIHSNGYCISEDDLGSGVTCCGSASLVWARDSFIHGNQGGGLIVQSSAKAIIQGCQLSQNHSGHDFGDLDVDTDAEVMLENCVLKGNGEHGREQYSVPHPSFPPLFHSKTVLYFSIPLSSLKVVCAQRNALLTLRSCDITCDPVSFGTGVDAQNGARLKLEGCNVHDCSGSGVLLRNANVTAEMKFCKFHNNKLHGLEIQAGTVDISDCKILDNVAHDIYISQTNGECKYHISRTAAVSFSLVKETEEGMSNNEGIPLDSLCTYSGGSL